MPNTNWARVKAVFLAATEIPETERRAFLLRVCAGDEDLAREVESLLESDDHADGFCETPAAVLIGIDAIAEAPPPPRLPVGARLGTYEIIGFLAAGGMGEVYRARDTRLGRDVAIKRVAGDVTDARATSRLVTEARHASSLKHQSICTIHEVGEADGLPFIVMELIDGRSLSDIQREGTPPFDVALGYAIDVADALEHAHGRGIIHRDLKSSNVMIDRSGHAIVLDFGLAKRLKQAGDSRSAPSMTETQLAPAGTLSHMAPEVLLGGRIDARSDVWSMGVLLYELMTGELPFSGRTAFETSSAILAEPPKRMPRAVPLAVRLVIERCIEKGPEARYQTASDVRAALKGIQAQRTWPIIRRLLIPRGRKALQIAATLTVVALGGLAAMALRQSVVTEGPHINTLAVLPLDHGSGNSADEVFAAGITEALNAQLGAAAQVHVISPTSAMHVAGLGKTSRDMGRALSADAVVEGTVERSSNQIRMTLRVIDVATGTVLWSDTLTRGARSVLVLQADAVRAVAAGIRATLRPDAIERLTMVPAISPEVYDAYLKGRYAWNHRTQTSLQTAVDEFTRAISLDPTYAPAHAGLADCYNQFGTVMIGGGSPRDYRPKAAAEAIKALQIDPGSADAHAALGYTRHYEWQWADAEKEFLRAIELNPNHVLARVYYGNLLMSLGRPDESLDQLLAARELDPFSLVVNTNVGWMLDEAGRHDDAIEQLTRTVALDPAYPQARTRLAGALSQAGRFDEVFVQVAEVLRLTKRSANSVGLLTRMSAMAGRTAEARTALGELQAIARRQYVPPATFYTVYSALGETETALDWLERAYDERSNILAYIGNERKLRSNPRFQSILHRVGLD